MLLLDQRLIHETANARLAVSPVQKHEANPLFGEDKPWEVRYDNVYPNVLWDEMQQKYRCWYNLFLVDPGTTEVPREQRAHATYDAQRPREHGICYAESDDGLNWTKPQLGLVEFNGSAANNIVLRSACGAGILIEPHDPQPDRRYKMMYGGEWTGDYQSNSTVRFSGDGLNWSAPHRCREIDAEADTHCNTIWLPQQNTYVAITRLHGGEPFEVETAHRLERYPAGQRTVGLTESADFETWSKSIEVLRGDRMNQTYSMQIFPWDGIYLGLVMMIHLDTDLVDCELTWSPDAVHWDYVDRGNPIIANGATEGDCDWGCVYAATAPMATADDIRVYYGSSNNRHWSWRDNYLCLGTLRPDGWAGYEPIDPDQVATVVTAPIECRRGLGLTADAAGGPVQISVIDEDGNLIAAGEPIRADVTNHAVAFAESDLLARLAGRPVRLKFELRGAKIYSVDMRE
ncbi:MAG: hypothetical protein CMJ49_00980 [Planctomycetaceae bacterium]|nr:hypothetical protein [Planctomycetaceae bacterium]